MESKNLFGSMLSGLDHTQRCIATLQVRGCKILGWFQGMLILEPEKVAGWNNHYACRWIGIWDNGGELGMELINGNDPYLINGNTFLSIPYDTKPPVSADTVVYRICRLLRRRSILWGRIEDEHITSTGVEPSLLMYPNQSLVSYQ